MFLPLLDAWEKSPHWGIGQKRGNLDFLPRNEPWFSFGVRLKCFSCSNRAIKDGNTRIKTLEMEWGDMRRRSHLRMSPPPDTP